MLRIVLGGVYGSPPPTKRRYRQYSPSTLTNAYESVMDGDLSVRKASKVFNVPMQTLRDRVIGHVGPETLRSGPGPLLNELEEARLVEFIKEMARVGYAYTRAEVINVATEYAACLGRRPNDKPFSYKWFYAFLGRWPELKVQRPKSISELRAKATSRESISNYFQELDKILTKYDLKNCPEAIYNVDEKGVQQNFKPSYVVGSSDCTPSVITSERSSTTTILGCGNALGQQIPPYFVFAGARMRSELMEGGSPGADGTVSKSGWSNGEVFQNYLENHFIKFAVGKRPLIILYDGHRSHISPYIIDWAIEQNIILYVLPPHTSHILQPMDVGCFGPFAKVYSAECLRFQRTTGRVVDRYSVCSISCKAYTAALSPANLQSAFRKAGIYPLQPSVVDTDLFVSHQLRTDLQAAVSSFNDAPEVDTSKEPEPLPDSEETLPYVDDDEIFFAVPLEQAQNDIIEQQNTVSQPSIETNVQSDENPLIKEFFKKKRPVFQPPFKSEKRSISKISAGKAITEPDVSVKAKEYLNSVPAAKKICSSEEVCCPQVSDS